jgi:hypothetical protein
VTDEILTAAAELRTLSDDDATSAVSFESPNSHQYPFYHGKSGPAAEGARVVEGLRAGPLATIEACVATVESKRKYQDKLEAITAFLKPLVEAKVLSSSEARLGLASPKLSMLCKIGEYAPRLRHPAILGYLLDTGVSGHTLIYQVAVLLDQTQDGQGEDARTQQLVDLLRERKVETRQGMLQLTKELKRPKGVHAATSQVPTEHAMEDSGVDNKDGALGPISVERDEIDGKFDFVLAVPGPTDLRGLQDYYEGTPPKCLRTGESVTEEATLVVVSALANLPVIVEKLIPFCGFGGVPIRVFLSRAPAAPEITGEQVIIVTERGSSGRAQVSEIEWISQTVAIDPLSIAARLVPDAKNKLCLFASAETDGWQSVIGDSNWSQADE